MTQTGTTQIDTRDQIRDLESQFAEAMTRLYAVGNGLARLRQDLDASVTPVSPPGTHRRRMVFRCSRAR